MPRHTLPEMATDLAERAKAGEIDPEDAMDLYLEYYRASMGVFKADPTLNTARANASKLRQVIKAADPDLLRRVSDIYDQMHHKVPCRPLYHGMVDVCRHRLDTKGHISDATIKGFLKKK
jgi:hypothetical protein